MSPISYLFLEIKDATPAIVGRVERSSIVRSTSLYVTYKKFMQYNRELILKIQAKREKVIRENAIQISKEKELEIFSRVLHRHIYGTTGPRGLKRIG